MSDPRSGLQRPGVFQFSTDDLNEKDRIEQFLETYGRTIIKHDIDPLPGTPFRMEARLFANPELGVASSALSPCDAPRTPKHLDGDDLVLTITLDGGRSVHQRGRQAVATAGEAVLTTGADTGHVHIPVASRMLSFRIPLATMRPMIADFDGSLVRAIPRETPALRLLTSYAGEIVRADALATPQMRGHVVAHLRDLIAMTIGATRDAAQLARGRGVGAARLQAIKADIIGKLGCGDLTIEAIAAAHGISSRYVRALFDAEGTTFSEFVVVRRLALAHRKLSDPHYAGHTISAIAFECGFGDLSYFNRVFRRQYGATPSDVRDAAQRAQRS
jgi:AraC-like DNA-binding protein